MSGEAKQKVADALEQLLRDIWDSARPPEPSNVGPATIDENGRITIPFTVSFEMFCTMVGNLYRMGETHEYVTSWIEQHMPDFREYFIEIHLSGGSKMWARKPDRVVLTIDVGEMGHNGTEAHKTKKADSPAEEPARRAARTRQAID